ncbi:MAG: PhzF family phenazine biosynthesis protein [Vicinamibacterales bacterium]
MRRVPFTQVDVFTEHPFQGNPVAVVFEGDDLTDGQMQRIAAWTNLSETTFVCRPTVDTADYRLRIFTPRSELPFAGHPTIGSAWAILERGLTPRVARRLTQECAKGLVQLRVDDNRLLLALPEPIVVVPQAESVDAVALALGLEPNEIRHAAIVDVGAVWFTVQLQSADHVIALTPDMARLATLGPRQTGVCVFGLRPATDAPRLEVRAFAPAIGIPEDPVCGSGNGCVAALIRRHELLDVQAYVASQGRMVGRDGRVHVEYAADGTIWLGGHAVTCIDGRMSLP